MTLSEELNDQLLLGAKKHRALEELLEYEQPGKYLVRSTAYDDAFATPVLTAGKTFILGYTDEAEGIYYASAEAPVIIFDDFTTSFKWVDFPFKAKSSAMKLLTPKSGEPVSLRYLYYAMQCIEYKPKDHSRQWIAKYSRFRVPLPSEDVQAEIVHVLDRFAALRRELEAELKARAQQRLACLELLPRSERIAKLAKEGYENVAIGDIATQSIDPVLVKADEEYINLGVKWYGEGAFARDAKRGSEIKAKKLFPVEPDQFIYNRMFVTEGSFGLVTTDLAHGVVSGEFPVYDLDRSRVVPEWLLLKFQHPHTVSAAASEARGGTKSRRRWKEKQFEAFRIELPPLEAQQEIVRVARTFSELESHLAAELEYRDEQFHYYLRRLIGLKEVST